MGAGMVSNWLVASLSPCTLAHAYKLQLKLHCADAALACSFVTGGEDGYVRLQHFDATYFNMLNKQEL